MLPSLLPPQPISNSDFAGLKWCHHQTMAPTLLLLGSKLFISPSWRIAPVRWISATSIKLLSLKVQITAQINSCWRQVLFWIQTTQTPMSWGSSEMSMKEPLSSSPPPSLMDGTTLDWSWILPPSLCSIHFSLWYIQLTLNQYNTSILLRLFKTSQIGNRSLKKWHIWTRSIPLWSVEEANKFCFRCGYFQERFPGKWNQWRPNLWRYFLGG